MSYRLIDGDYSLGDGKIVSVDYLEALLQKAYLALKGRRGKFYPNKNFGSFIAAIKGEPFEKYAEAFARQALDEIDGVFVKAVERSGKELKIRLILNDEEGEVILPVENDI